MRALRTRFSVAAAILLTAAGCKDGGGASAQKASAQRAAAAAAASAAPARPAEDLDKAFAAAFGQAPPMMRIVNRNDDYGAVTYRYRPLKLVPLGERAALISGGWTDTCHACAGTLTIHYLARTPDGYRMVGAWPEILTGGSFGEPPQFSVRDDLFPAPAIVATSGGTWQGCTHEMADLVELTPQRPIVRASKVLLHWDEEGASDNAPEAIDGEIKPKSRGDSFSVDYTGGKRLSVLYVRDGDVYQPAHAEPGLEGC